MAGTFCGLPPTRSGSKLKTCRIFGFEKYFLTNEKRGRTASSRNRSAVTPSIERTLPK